MTDQNLPRRISNTGNAWLEESKVYNITAVPNDGYFFDYWAIEGVGSIGDTTSAETTFTPGDGGAIITANYVSIISLIADNSTTPSYTFESSGLDTTIKLKISGDSGEFLTILESTDGIDFRLTIGGTESEPTLTLNDGASDFGTLSEGESTTYTLSDSSVLTFLFDSLGSIVLHITKSIDVQDALLTEDGKVLNTESENYLGFQ